MICEVIVFKGPNLIFDYNFFDANIIIGDLISVPFNGKDMNALVINIKKTSKHKLKDINPTFNLNILSTDDISNIKWISSYYHYSYILFIQQTVPAYFKNSLVFNFPKQVFYKLINENIKLNNPKQEELLISLKEQTLEKKDILKKISNRRFEIWLENKIISPLQSLPSKNFITLNKQQNHIYEKISKTNNAFGVHLINGITGSGKTQIYIKLLKELIKENKQGMLLIPEINLTPQIKNELLIHFKGMVGVINSSISDKEKARVWHLTKNGEIKLVLGTRSAVFTPFKNLGMVIIDEEHDSSYKQTERFIYHARNYAIKIAQLNKCPVILGSATPSLESYYNYISGKYNFYSINERFNNTKAPVPIIVHKEKKLISEQILNEIRDTLNNNQQVLVFKNRRGFATLLKCNSCHEIYKCQKCSKNLSYHKKLNQIICHSCLTNYKILSQCNSCNLGTYLMLGSGTEKIEDFLKKEIPNTKIVIFDSDHIKNKNELQNILKELNSKVPMIVVGTQMLATGHNFKGINLACILDIDTAFLSQDYKAIEKTGQLIFQASGRAGRDKDATGKVYLQSEYPQHDFFTFIKKDYCEFLNWILTQRKENNLPPYIEDALITVSHTNINYAFKICKESIKDIPEANKMGPYPAIIEKIDDKFRVQSVIKAQNKILLHQILKKVVSPQKSTACRFTLDVHPTDNL